MRYDTPIFFQTVQQGDLNPETHNYDNDIVIENKRFARVTDTGESTLKLVYNDLKQGSLTVKLQRPFPLPFDNIRIGEKIYKVDFSRHKKNFVVSEVQ